MKRQQHNTASLRGGRQPDAAIYSEHTRLLRFLLRPSGFAGQDARNDRERGNALWFILVAIGLLGLLTVMLSRSGSNTNETGGYEQNVIAANEILSYAKNMENAVQGLLARDCSENELSFWHDSNGDGIENASDNYFNTVSTRTDRSCHIFDVAGAGLTWDTPDERWHDKNYDTEVWYDDWNFTAASTVVNAGTTCNSKTCTDLVAVLSFINQNICLRLNELVNLDNPSGSPPTENSSVSFNSNTNNFNGSNFTFQSGIDITAQKFHSGCIKATSLSGSSFPNTFHFYHVLHAR